METEFFITEYCGPPREGMKCILKHLYSDFIVREISANGIVCEISTSASVDAETTSNVTENTDCIDSSSTTPSSITDENLNLLDELLSDESKVVSLPVQTLTKDQRTEIHVWIRERYKGRLQSRTDGGNIYVSVSGSDRKRVQWPRDRPDFLHFTLSKENKDTQYALSLVAKFLGTKVTNFGIRGTKDRRAVTAQRVSLYRYNADRVRRLNSRLRGIRLSDFGYEEKPCILGNLWGNRFQIALRKLSLPDDEVKKRVQELTVRGFINYFGTQRFGSCGVSTANVGRAIIRKDWKEAVLTILGPRDVNGSLGDALKTWQETGDANLALKELSGSQAFASIESRILKALTKGDYRSALMCLSRSARSLYVHAFQSLLWNKIVSMRVRKYGLRVLKGDIDVHGTELEEDDICKVALPLPSFEMKLPRNDTAKWYDELFKQTDIRPELFAAVERDYAVANVLRPIIVKAKDVDFEILHYCDPDTKLQPDLDGRVDKRLLNEGTERALLLNFSLPAGSYATVALREITRCDMGKFSQSVSSKQCHS